MEVLESEWLEERFKGDILPIEQRTKFVQIALVINLFISSFYQFMNWYFYSSLTSYQMGINEIIAASESNGFLRLLNLVNLVSVLVTIVAFCLWIYRAHQNHHLFGVRNLSYSPGWIIGWFFIPLANLILPFLTLQEVWNAHQSMKNSEQLKRNGVAGFILVWWNAMIAPLFVYLSFFGSLYSSAIKGRINPYEVFSDLSDMALFNIFFILVAGSIMLMVIYQVNECNKKF